VASNSFTKSIDLALKLLLYNRFGSILGIDTQSSIAEDNINKGVIQIPKEVAQREIAEKRGEYFLEFMNFWRVGTGFSWDRNRTPVARRGIWLANVDENKKTDTVHVTAVPVDLNYNVWFWTTELDKAYECIEEYLFWQQDFPKVTLKYDDIYELQPDLHFSEIVDESTVGEKYEVGRYFVFKMPIKIDGWVIKGLSFKTINKIILTLYDKDNVTNYSEIVVEDSNQDVELAAALKMFRKRLYAILGIDLVDNVIIIPGNRVSEFNTYDIIFVENSTGNDGKYTVVSSSLNDTNTEIKLLEQLKSEIVIGNIYRNE
jgi:hypothetical protein